MYLTEEGSGHTQGIQEAFERRARELAEVHDIISAVQEGVDGLTFAERYLPTLQGLLENLSDRNVRLVVVGEFSRGKSSLLNALLGRKDFLPTSLSPTTAINTFIRGVNEEHPTPCILVHWSEPGKPPERLPWTGDEVLIRWGTELDKENAHGRDGVQRIEAFTDHPLFQHELIVIDTPGLGSLHGHHEKIMQQAIRAADMAIFVMSADQLGGNEHEWRFVRNNLRQNFGRFITIINFWDKVLEETSPQMSALTWEERTAHYLKIVRSSFQSALGDAATADLERLTQDDNLIPLIPQWAYLQEQDQLRYAWSGIDRLTRRLTELCIHGEAQREKLHTPLQRTHSVLEELLAELRQRQGDLRHPEGHEKLSYEIEHVEAQIKNIQLELNHHVQNARADHERNLHALQRESEAELLYIVQDVQRDVELLLTAEYVEGKLQAASARTRTKLELPPELQVKLNAAQQQLQERWNPIIVKTGEVLAELQASFAAHVEELSTKALKSLETTLPSLDLSGVALNLDLSALLDYERNQAELQREAIVLEERLEALRETVAERSMDDEQLKLQRAQLVKTLDQVRKAKDDLGPPPAPTASKKRRELGVFSRIHRYFAGEQPEDWIIEHDYTRVELHRSHEQHLEERAERLERELDKLSADLKSAKVTSLTERQKLKENERLLQKQKLEMEELKKKAEDERRLRIRQTQESMRAALISQLQGQEASIRRFIAETLKHTFQAQVDGLEHNVRQEFEEKLKQEVSRREELIAILQKGEVEIQAQLGQLQRYEETLETLLERVKLNLEFALGGV